MSYKIGDKVFIEQAWEDGTGRYHDEYAVILSISKTGKVKLKFEREIINEFLDSAEFTIDDLQEVKNGL